MKFFKEENANLHLTNESGSWENKFLYYFLDDEILVTEPKVSRLYIDGCFDLMHSGHFNAIR